MTRALPKSVVLASCLLVFPNVVGANPLSDCLRGRDAKKRLEACDTVGRDESLTATQRSRAFRQSGSLRAQAGAHVRAIKDFGAAIALSPTDTDAFERRALSYLVVKQFDQALTDFAVAISRKPRSIRLRIERGYLHLVAGRPDAAIADFNAALALNPRHAVALNNRGLAWRKKGDLARARADYTAAIQAQPTYALAFANRGYVSEAQGRKQEAIADFQRALRFDPKHEGAITGLARLGLTAAAARSGQLIGRGRQLVETLCSSCHAIGATGDSPNALAPRLRDLQKRYPLLPLRMPIGRGITAPHDQMPRFQLTPVDIDRIVAYVNTLNK